MDLQPRHDPGLVVVDRQRYFRPSTPAPPKAWARVAGAVQWIGLLVFSVFAVVGLVQGDIDGLSLVILVLVAAAAAMSIPAAIAKRRRGPESLEPVLIPDALYDDVRTLHADGSRVEGIKAIRSATGLSLTQAVAAYDAITA